MSIEVKLACSEQSNDTLSLSGSGDNYTFSAAHKGDGVGNAYVSVMGNAKTISAFLLTCLALVSRDTKV